MSGVLTAALFTWPATPRGQAAPGPRTIIATTREAAADWNRQIDRQISADTLRLRRSRPDTVLEGRTHDRFDQYYGGLRVLGAQVVRQLDSEGHAVSVFGGAYPEIAIATTPAISREQAIARAKALTGGEEMAVEPELLILPRENGTHALAWQVNVATRSDAMALFVDAQSGSELLRRSHYRHQTAVGTGRGVLGDDKKISTNRIGGAFFADDQHRPPAIVTFDLRGNLTRTNLILEGRVNAAQSDIASDTDNTWTDAATVDAHVYLGYTYDYYFKRFGRRGLDNNDRPIRAIVHPVSRSEAAFYLNTGSDVFDTFFVNAFWCGSCAGGTMMFGEGLPVGLFNVNVNYFAGALDIVGHELTHGVTEFSSDLIYENESGALNEAFSDIMGAAVEFFFQEPGNGANRADYMIGEDVLPNLGGWVRSMADPLSYGDPDHYSRRYIGSEDNGGVHINSSIVNHAYYLAVEGGTNRTSGRSVQGVGGANREQMEKVFYRAFVFLLPSNATFAVARQATLQAASDLYGTSSPAYRAVGQAWDAVGVF